MGLLDLIFGKPKRRRSTKRATSRKAPTRRDLDRQASRWLDTDNRRRTATKERADRKRQRDTARQAAREADAAIRVERSYRKTKDKLRREGWLEHEIDQLLHSVEINPSKRLARMSAACGGLCLKNPTAAEASMAFHGTPTKTKDGKVVVGTLENVQYRAPAGSRRAGVTWDHEAGDRGVLRPRNRGRAKLLADPNTGKVELDTRGSGMKWDSSHGLVG